MKTASNCCGEAVEGICCIKVLGAGCKSCYEQYENAKAAVAAMGLSVEVEYVTDMEMELFEKIPQIEVRMNDGKQNQGYYC